MFKRYSKYYMGASSDDEDDDDNDSDSGIDDFDPQDKLYELVDQRGNPFRSGSQRGLLKKKKKGDDNDDNDNGENDGPIDYDALLAEGNINFAQEVVDRRRSRYRERVKFFKERHKQYLDQAKDNPVPILPDPIGERSDDTEITPSAQEEIVNIKKKTFLHNRKRRSHDQLSDKKQKIKESHSQVLEQPIPQTKAKKRISPQPHNLVPDKVTNRTFRKTAVDRQLMKRKKKPETFLQPKEMDRASKNLPTTKKNLAQHRESKLKTNEPQGSFVAKRKKTKKTKQPKQEKCK